MDLCARALVFTLVLLLDRAHILTGASGGNLAVVLALFRKSCFARLGASGFHDLVALLLALLLHLGGTHVLACGGRNILAIVAASLLDGLSTLVRANILLHLFTLVVALLLLLQLGHQLAGALGLLGALICAFLGEGGVALLTTSLVELILALILAHVLLSLRANVLANSLRVGLALIHTIALGLLGTILDAADSLLCAALGTTGRALSIADDFLAHLFGVVDALPLALSLVLGGTHATAILAELVDALVIALLHLLGLTSLFADLFGGLGATLHHDVFGALVAVLHALTAALRLALILTGSLQGGARDVFARLDRVLLARLVAALLHDCVAHTAATLLRLLRALILAHVAVFLLADVLTGLFGTFAALCRTSLLFDGLANVSTLFIVQCLAAVLAPTLLLHLLHGLARTLGLRVTRSLARLDHARAALVTTSAQKLDLALRFALGGKAMVADLRANWGGVLIAVILAYLLALGHAFLPALILIHNRVHVARHLLQH